MSIKCTQTGDQGSDCEFVSCEYCGERVLWHSNECGADNPPSYNEYGTSEVFCSSDCFEERYTMCGHCHDYMNVNECYSYRHYGSFCGDCYSEVVWECQRCCSDFWHESNDISYNDETDELLCSSCNERAVIQAWNHRPEIVFHGKREQTIKSKPHGEMKRFCLWFGVEVETENLGDRDSTITSSKALLNRVNVNSEFIHLCRDGSLSSDRGVEIVTQPFSFDYWQENQNQFDDILKIRQDGFRSFHADSECGIHISLSKNAFTNFQLFKFLMFFENNWNFIYKVSQRKQNSRAENHWCQRNGMELKIPRIAKDKSHRGKYYAVNLGSPKRVEVRIFRGTLNKESFAKNIEFCHSLFWFTKSHPLNEMTFAHYFEFLMESKSSRSDYPNIINFINRRYADEVKNRRTAVISLPSMRGTKQAIKNRYGERAIIVNSFHKLNKINGGQKCA